MIITHPFELATLLDAMEAHDRKPNSVSRRLDPMGIRASLIERLREECAALDEYDRERQLRGFRAMND